MVPRGVILPDLRTFLLSLNGNHMGEMACGFLAQWMACAPQWSKVYLQPSEDLTGPGLARCIAFLPLTLPHLSQLQLDLRECQVDRPSILQFTRAIRQRAPRVRITAFVLGES